MIYVTVVESEHGARDDAICARAGSNLLQDLFPPSLRPIVPSSPLP